MISNQNHSTTSVTIYLNRWRPFPHSFKLFFFNAFIIFPLPVIAIVRSVLKNNIFSLEIFFKRTIVCNCILLSLLLLCKVKNEHIYFPLIFFFRYTFICLFEGHVFFKNFICYMHSIFLIPVKLIL